MRLFLDFGAISSDTGVSGAAYGLLLGAGQQPTVEYLPASGRREALRRLTGQEQTPVLVTAAGDVISGLHGILAYIERTQ